MKIPSIFRRINQSSFIKKLLYGSLWMTLGTLVSRGLLMLASIILARILTVSEYGEFGMIKSTIDNFLIFASLGIGLTTTKYVSERKDHDKAGTSSILGASISLVLLLSTVVSILIALFSGFIVENILNNESLQLPLIMGSFTLMFVALNGTQMGALLGFQAYRKNSFSNILQGIFLFSGLTIGGYFGGVTGAFLGNLIAIFLVSVVLQKLLRDEGKLHNVSINLHNWRDNVKTIYKFAIPASLSTIIVAPTIWFLNTLLVNQPNGYKQLGLYSAVIIFSTAIQMFNGSISNVLLPIFLSKSEEKTPKKEFFNYFGGWIISILLAFPILSFPEIVAAILGDKYVDTEIVPILGMSVISTLVIANRGGVSRDLIIKNKMWLSVFSMGQWALTNLVVFYFLKSYGAWGFALSYMISYLINYVLFVPFFISKNIVPKIVFYSKWNFAIWILLFSLAFVCTYYYEAIIIRLFSVIAIFGLLSYSIFKYYKECLIKL
ncbi:oligosaccharide flippase family protein [Flavobacterium sp. NST-5]|uniref:Oligosaccharide flippase family protein n=1 Tax=Flavobacterium ichthyis TaxID=2698827 RepID=A0ABW9Z867_9FLAO|nr:oligosaccharide flippase family protein [Flavobacterium ichthyis]NBL64814.1 oligosaccharide flippase family protein [Flavobacterium ichthyis]